MDLDDLADEAFDASVVQYMDDELEARAENAQRNADKRRASGISTELLSLPQSKRRSA